MANLTLSVDDDLLWRARMRALDLGTTVDILLREYLESFAGESPVRAAVAEFLDIAGSVQTSSGPAGHNWSREDLHAR